LISKKKEICELIFLLFRYATPPNGNSKKSMAQLNKIKPQVRNRHQSQSQVRPPQKNFESGEDEHLVSKEPKITKYEIHDSGIINLSFSACLNKMKVIKYTDKTNKVRESSFSKDTMRPTLVNVHKRTTESKSLALH
jgi:hypothetical protein